MNKTVQLSVRGIEVPTEFIRKDYDMNPETEDIIRGRTLHNGMIVLLEESVMRENPENHLDENPHVCDAYRCARIKETSRWCLISQLERRGDIMSFVGVYSDGVKKSRTYNESFFWIVKKEKI